MSDQCSLSEGSQKNERISELFCAQGYTHIHVYVIFGTDYRCVGLSFSVFTSATSWQG